MNTISRNCSQTILKTPNQQQNENKKPNPQTQTNKPPPYSTGNKPGCPTQLQAAAPGYRSVDLTLICQPYADVTDSGGGPEMTPNLCVPLPPEWSGDAI